MWISIRAQESVMPVVVGPVSEVVAAAGDAALLPANHRAAVVEWSLVHGLLAVWQRCGDRYELAWEASGADELRSRDERPIDFVKRSTADERRREWRRSPGQREPAAADPSMPVASFAALFGVGKRAASST